jgi:hypothetical protein
MRQGEKGFFMEQSTFARYKEAFLAVNGETDLDGREWTDKQIRQDAPLNDIDLID